MKFQVAQHWNNTEQLLPWICQVFLDNVCRCRSQSPTLKFRVYHIPPIQGKVTHYRQALIFFFDIRRQALISLPPSVHCLVFTLIRRIVQVRNSLLLLSLMDSSSSSWPYVICSSIPSFLLFRFTSTPLSTLFICYREKKTCKPDFTSIRRLCFELHWVFGD